MAKYYISSGDLQEIISTEKNKKDACKSALEKFLINNKNSKEKSIGITITISEQGFRYDKSKVLNKNDDSIQFDVMDLLNLI